MVQIQLSYDGKKVCFLKLNDTWVY